MVEQLQQEIAERLRDIQDRLGQLGDEAVLKGYLRELRQIDDELYELFEGED